MKIIISIIMLLNFSCASNAKEKWRVTPVSNKSKIWLYCNAVDEQRSGIDGINQSGKLCFWQEQCKKRFLRKKKCRQILITCTPTNKECMDKYQIWSKRIK